MGSRRTTIITSTYVAPKQPPAQPVVQSGRIVGMPVTYSVGATRRVQPAPDYPVQVQPYNPFRNAYNTIPYVPYRPRSVYNPVVQPITPPQTVTNNSLSSAGVLKDQVCDDILSDPVSGVDSFTVTGNGKATRFRFPEAGAPSEIAVTNDSTGDTVSSSDYSVLVRGDSVAWLIFDTAPADGVSYSVKYVLGDSPFIRNVRVGSWTDWLVKLNSLQRQLLSAKNNSQTNQRYIGGYRTYYNRVPESAAYDSAIEAVVQLKKEIATPGNKMNLKTIAAACNNIEDQLAKLNAGTGKRSQADSTVGGPLVATPTITRGANIVFEFDNRYSSFSKRSYNDFGKQEYYYNGKLYTVQYDSSIRANYFDLNAGRIPTPPRTYGNDGGGNDGWEENPNEKGGSSRGTSTSSSGTGVTGSKSGVTAAEPSTSGGPSSAAAAQAAADAAIDNHYGRNDVGPGSSVDSTSPGGQGAYGGNAGFA